MMSARLVAIAGAAFVSLGPLSMSIYTPAMPSIAEAFAVDEGAVQFTLVAYFFGFSFAQLACGPLADAFGRRIVLQLFLATYIAGSALALAATSIDGLSAARLIQGIGAAAGITVTRAIVRDLFDDERAGQVLGSVGTMLAILPAFAPGLGGLLLTVAPWPGLFVLMIAFGVFLLLLCTFCIEETNPEPDRRKAAPVQVARTYARLLGRGPIVASMSIAACSIGCIYMLSTVLAFVADADLGLSPAQFGAAMLLQSAFYTLGALLARRLLRHRSAASLVLPASLLMLAAGLLLAVNAARGFDSLAAVFLPVGLYAFAVAMATPGFTVQALRNTSKEAGAASALLGFSQLGGGFVGGLLVTLFPSPSSALGTLPLLMAAIACLSQLYVLREARSGRV
ncbi:MFS transporter [Aureimonas populi]|uniref:MFS transporter n=1 Tax=Aureimonas populi TaxID=1701758 RepID=A0ABW5CPS9_9HYPH|nr:MFS transporter [Aureimonas populi]